MSIPPPRVPQVVRLTTSQIAEFKREGFLVLPGVLDTGLCRQVRDQMWEAIAAHRPTMKRDDPSTWMPFTGEETASYQRPRSDAPPYFTGNGHRLYVYNGADALI